MRDEVTSRRGRKGPEAVGTTSGAKKQSGKSEQNSQLFEMTLGSAIAEVQPRTKTECAVAEARPQMEVERLEGVMELAVLKNSPDIVASREMVDDAAVARETEVWTGARGSVG